jgi:hypothetical protein
MAMHMHITCAQHKDLVRSNSHLNIHSALYSVGGQPPAVGHCKILCRTAGPIACLHNMHYYASGEAVHMNVQCIVVQQMFLGETDTQARSHLFG